MQSIILSYRHLKGNKTNLVINVLSLALALGVVSVITVFVINELSYNHAYPKGERVYRILNYDEGNSMMWANTPYALGTVLPEKSGDIEGVVQQYSITSLEIRHGASFVEEKDILCTNASFFQVFDVEILQGAITDLDQKNNGMALSQSMAKRYFGGQNPLGNLVVVRYEGKEFPMEIVAVYQDLPSNSTFKANCVVNAQFGLEHLLASLITTSDEPVTMQMVKESWQQGLFFSTYVLLGENSSVQSLESQLSHLSKEYGHADEPLHFSAQPFHQVYFNSATFSDNNNSERGSKSVLLILSLTGFLILTMACINYINLTSAQMLTQVKALAIRKVCGATRMNLIVQMVSESVLVALMSFPLAFILAHYSLPYLSQLLGKSYSLTLSQQLDLGLMIVVSITLLTGFITGLLVARHVTGIQTIEALKGDKMIPAGRNYIRQAMVVLQLAIFMVLLTAMIVVRKQVDYAFTKDLGFNMEGLLRVPAGDRNIDLFKKEIIANPNVLGVSSALWVPPHKGRMMITVPMVSDPSTTVTVYGDFVDYRFVETMGLKLLQGSDFIEGGNTSGVLVNEAAIKSLGLTTILGEQTAFGPVIGVVSDFNMYSLHSAIPPMIIGFNPSMNREVVVRIRLDQMHETLNFLKDQWNKCSGTSPFDFSFSDDILTQLYQKEIQLSKTITLLALLAISIAAMGLFGLSIFICKQRTKEIGIRKVNGARIGDIMLMLNLIFGKWVLFAFCLAVPVAWYVMSLWLQGFAYKTELSWWIFLLSGLATLLITAGTVSWHSWRAASNNPVESLISE
ncbi:MAG: FtsX-like permease family protein [Breznakibacter sp.]